MPDETSKQDLSHHLDAMAQLEHKQVLLLSQALQCIDDPDVRTALQDILDEELGHEDHLGSLKEYFQLE